MISDEQSNKSESQYRAIFEGAPVAMWDEDFSGIKLLLDSLAQSGVGNIGDYLQNHPAVLYDCISQVQVRHVNRVAREFYGAETEQDLIAALPTLFDESSVDIFRKEVTAFAQGATNFEAELSVRTLAGERRQVVMNVSMLGSPVPDWARVVVTFTDITERRRLEQSLKNANASLHRLNHHLEQFAYAAAHDMREPLRTIALYAQLLQRQHPPGPGTSAETALNYILQNGRRMETLMDDLLAFASVVDPESDPVSEGSHPEDAIHEAMSSLSTSIQQSGAQIVIGTDLPRTKMKLVHLRQLFQNLLSNAIKYRAAQGPPIIRIGAEAIGGEFQFKVADNGIGIRSEYHQQIFGIFKRLHGREIDGNGIGLALCKKIVEDYGGRIWVESETDQGATFYFTVPYVSDFP